MDDSITDQVGGWFFWKTGYYRRYFTACFFSISRWFPVILNLFLSSLKHLITYFKRWYSRQEDLIYPWDLNILRVLGCTRSQLFLWVTRNIFYLMMGFCYLTIKYEVYSWTLIPSYSLFKLRQMLISSMTCKYQGMIRVYSTFILCLGNKPSVWGARNGVWDGSSGH